MAKITIKEVGTFDIPDDARLVLAIKDAGVDILHRCGGYAGCTTCRVTITEGEPDKITEAEYNKLEENDQIGEFRLSCQVLCDQDMTVEPLMRVSTTNYDEAGKRPQDEITPEPVWVDKS